MNRSRSLTFLCSGFDEQFHCHVISLPLSVTKRAITHDERYLWPKDLFGIFPPISEQDFGESQDVMKDYGEIE